MALPPSGQPRTSLVRGPGTCRWAFYVSCNWHSEWAWVWRRQARLAGRGVALLLFPGLWLEPEERRFLFHSELVLTAAPAEHLAASPVGLEPHQISALSLTSCVPLGNSLNLSVPDSLV